MVDFLYLESASGSFVWNVRKETINVYRHGINFKQAAQAFADPDRLILEDRVHSRLERRLFCVGVVDGRVLTVRFMYRENRIRIIGAGVWRKWRKLYEKKNAT